MEQNKERKLEIEARTVSLGELGNWYAATDFARVEVSWSDANDVEHAGYFRVNVNVTGDPEDLSNHPATIAQDRAMRELEIMAEREGWTYYSVDDVFAA